MATKKIIASFRFNDAQYEVADDHGGSALLKVHYADNTFEVVNVRGNSAFRRELKRIAADLLRRKHGANFADRVQ